MEKNRTPWIILVIILWLASSLVGVAAGGLGVYAYLQGKPATPAATTETAPASTMAAQTALPSTRLVISNTQIETTITKIVQDYDSAVVTVVGTIDVQTFPFGLTSTSQVSGSGFFLTQDGYIATNFHVVNGTNQLWVVLSDGTKLDATLVGSDQYADVAVLKVNTTSAKFVTLGNSDLIDPGQTVIAIGSPLGEFRNSVTVGVVSATGRSLDTGNGYTMENLIQTDAAINQGNSGGPLLNLAGEVIAINTLIVRSSGSGAVAEGLGFAIPSNTVAAISSQLITTGHFSRPSMGITWQSLSPMISARYGLPVEYGIYITGVIANGPAAEAGLQVGDIITRVGDVQLDDTHSFINELFKYEAGSQVSITYLRNGRANQVTVTLTGS